MKIRSPELQDMPDPLFRSFQRQILKFGFKLEKTDKKEYVVTTIPTVNVDNVQDDLQDMLIDFKSTLLEEVYPKSLKQFCASKACRSAIMIGDILTKLQQQKVVLQLSKLDHPWQCPHGRPTAALLTRLYDA